MEGTFKVFLMKKGSGIGISDTFHSNTWYWIEIIIRCIAHHYSLISMDTHPVHSGGAGCVKLVFRMPLWTGKIPAMMISPGTETPGDTGTVPPSATVNQRNRAQTKCAISLSLSLTLFFCHSPRLSCFISCLFATYIMPYPFSFSCYVSSLLLLSSCGSSWQTDGFNLNVLSKCTGRDASFPRAFAPSGKGWVLRIPSTPFLPQTALEAPHTCYSYFHLSFPVFTFKVCHLKEHGADTAAPCPIRCSHPIRIWNQTSLITWPA